MVARKRTTSAPSPPHPQARIEPRTVTPMRSLTVRVGDRIAWFPQALTSFVAHYSELLSSDDDGHHREIPASDWGLMVHPEDGTANQAHTGTP